MANLPHSGVVEFGRKAAIRTFAEGLPRAQRLRHNMVIQAALDDPLSTLEELQGVIARVAQLDASPQVASVAVAAAAALGGAAPLTTAHTVPGGEAARRAAIQHFAQHQAVPGHDDLIQAALADGRSTAGEVAQRIVARERAAPQRHAAVQPAVAAPVPSSHVDAERLDALAESEWKGSADLQAEFRSLGAYQAWRRAEAQGLARVFKSTPARPG